MAENQEFVDQADLISPGEETTSDIQTIDTTNPSDTPDAASSSSKFDLGEFTLPDRSGGNLPNRAKFKDLLGYTLHDVNRDEYTKYLGHEPFSFITQDPDDLRARAQTFGEKLKYMPPKLVTRVGTNILGSTVGLLYGGGAFLSEIGNGWNSMQKAFFDNSFQRSLDGINEWMDGKLPHYYTKEEQQYGFFQSAFGP